MGEISIKEIGTPVIEVNKQYDSEMMKYINLTFMSEEYHYKGTDLIIK